MKRLIQHKNRGILQYAQARIKTARQFTARLLRVAGTHAALLGLALTLMVALVDWHGWLHPVERNFYNTRARNCQFFTPAPPDRLVHVDIDDAALETIGRWPWPRSTLAQIIDELRLSGASELSMDILFADPQKPEAVRKPDGSVDVIDHDANLAAAITRFGKVVVPVDFGFVPQVAKTPTSVAMARALHDDLQLRQEEIKSYLPPRARTPTEDEFLAARREAMTMRLEEGLARDSLQPEEFLRQQLLPRIDRAPPGSSIQHEFDVTYQKALCTLIMSRFALNKPAPSVTDQMLRATEQLTMTLPFARATTFTGYVNYLPLGRDPTIDMIPICVLYHGRLYPQMDLSLACAAMNIDPQNIVVLDNEIVLPRPDGEQTIMPVHKVNSDLHGTISMFMDIPWFGKRDWTTMYDYPSYTRPRRHVPITLPFAIGDAKKRIQQTSDTADRAIQFFEDAGLDSAKNFRKSPPPTEKMMDRIAGWKSVLAEALPLAQQAQSVPEAERNADDKAFFSAFNGLDNAVKNMSTDWPVLQSKIADLRTAVGGKTILIGNTATAVGDFYPTPLHPSCPGVVIHGVVFNAIYTGRFLRSAPPWVTLMITVVLGCLTTSVVIRHNALTALTLTILIGVSYLLINSLLVFDYGKWMVGLAGPTVVIAVVWGALTLVRFIAESQERARITRRFQSYIDPAIVQYYLDHPHLEGLEGEFREMTVCFTDIAGFTTFTEKLREKAVKVLGRYIVKMVPPIRNNGGLIHHRMGDGIMFSYGAPIPNPDMAIGAVTSVLEMHEALTRFNDELEAEGIPRLAMRAGVNTGMAVVGDSGASDATEYACLGDTTNLASRLEGANTFTGTKILIAGRTAELLRGQFLLRPIARLIVKGKSEPVMTFEPLARIQVATENEKYLVAMTAAIFDSFVRGDFDQCVTATGDMDQAFGPTVFAKLYRDLSQRYLADPPVKFEGNIVLNEK